MISHYKGQEFSRTAKVIDKLRAGEDVALVSDAGTPAVSDPGAILVHQAVASGVKVEPIPGASALTAALSVAGLTETPFTFLGFLPGKKGDRRRLLQSLSASDPALAFYESPRRIISTLRECLDILGDRPTFLGRELTKLHEELFHSPLSEIIEELESRSNIKGEFVVIIDGVHQGKGDQPVGDLEDVLVWYRDHSGLSMSDSCRKVATDLGLSRSEIYSQALKIWK
jgi:16S rRNA (cytidine1402-2'-O)-methyltransferase